MTASASNLELETVSGTHKLACTSRCLWMSREREGEWPTSGGCGEGGGYFSGYLLDFCENLCYIS